MGDTGCLGGLVQLVLGVLNFMFLLVGSAMVTLGALARWGDFNLNHIIHNQEVQSIIEISNLDSVSIAFLAIGGFIVLLSVAGLFGLCCTNKFFLIIYQVIVSFLFAVHLISFILVLVKGNDLERIYRSAIDSSIADINANWPNTKQAQHRCEGLKVLSKFWDCCGASSPLDFKKQVLRENCCFSSNLASNSIVEGCTEKSISFIKSNAAYALIIPNAVILTVEAAILLVVPCFIKRISSRK